MKMTEQLLTIARAYCDAKGISLARLSTLVFNDGKRFGAIERGGDLGTTQFEKALDWLSDNWPDGVEWPEDIARPRCHRAT